MADDTRQNLCPYLSLVCYAFVVVVVNNLVGSCFYGVYFFIVFFLAIHQELRHTMSHTNLCQTYVHINTTTILLYIFTHICIYKYVCLIAKLRILSSHACHARFINCLLPYLLTQIFLISVIFSIHISFCFLFIKYFLLFSYFLQA